MTFPMLMKRPTAFMPVAMSLAALALVLVYVGTFGIPHEADEGTPAHIFQLLMMLQLPMVAIFLIKWLSQAPRQAIQVLTLQIVAALAALAPVFYLNL